MIWLPVPLSIFLTGCLLCLKGKTPVQLRIGQMLVGIGVLGVNLLRFFL